MSQPQAGSSTRYPTQEDELRAKEAQAEGLKSEAEASFLSTFQTVPKQNGEKLSRISRNIVESFNNIMIQSRTEPYEKQENLMAGLKRLIREEINVIEARRLYTLKINHETASSRNM